MKILWFNCRILHPLIGGDRIRTYQMLAAMKNHHEITYLCLQTPADLPDAVERATEYSHQIETVAHPVRTPESCSNRLRQAFEALFSSQPLIATKYDSAKIRERLVELVRKDEYDLVICDYLAPAINLLEIRGRIEPPLILFHHNVESSIWKRHRENAGNAAMGWLFHLQWQRTLRLEETAAAIVDGQITVSEDDRRHFADERGMENVLGAVPTGVDFDVFKPNPALREPLTAAFLGAMDWHANVDAVGYFVDEILPRIRAEVPGVRLLIIGRNPAGKILSMAENDPDIEVSGTVEDVQPWLHRAAAMILPLRVGGGTRIKVYESIAAGVPVVSTSIGVEGLDLTPGRHYRLGDDAAAFAEETVDLLMRPAEAGKMATAALEHISSRYNWKAVSSRFCELCQPLIGRSKPVDARANR